MTRNEWQIKYDLTDGEMQDINLVRAKFNAQEIVVLRKGEPRWKDLNWGKRLTQ